MNAIRKLVADIPMKPASSSLRRPVLSISAVHNNDVKIDIVLMDSVAYFAPEFKPSVTQISVE
jgi:hypothetical protein